MVAIHTPHNDPTPANQAKSGEGYDRCPSDGCVEVDPTFQRGGIDTKGEEYRNYFIYSADRKQGGCGMQWSRTTAQGRQHDVEHGIQTRWLTTSAARGRTYLLSPQSEAYAENYRKAFGHD